MSGDTLIVSRGGVLPIRDLIGNPTLLIPRMGSRGGLLSRGVFHKAEIRSQGSQQIWEIELRRMKAIRVIRTTAEQRWFITTTRSKEEWKNPEECWRFSQQLQIGDCLRTLRANAPIKEQRIMPVAVAQGFVFGDGTRARTDERPAYVNLNGAKDRALLPFFAGYQPHEVLVHSEYKGKTVPKKTALKIYGLPRFWKQLPPINESRSFLLSWLAGYFAADGSVNSDSQAVLCSAHQENLKFARSALAVCGVGYASIRRSTRLGKGTKPSALYRMNLRLADLPSWFFLLSHHHERVNATRRSAFDTPWSVVCIRKTKRHEEVFGMSFKGSSAFGLSEDLACGGI